MKKTLSVVLAASILGLAGCGDEPTKADQAKQKIEKYQEDNKSKVSEQKKNADELRNKMWGKYKKDE